MYAVPMYLLIVAQSLFNIDRIATFVISLIAILIVLYTTYFQKKDKQFTIRKINGLKAVEDAIGRATEMARPILYTPGWGGDIQRPTTIASMNILSFVAEKTSQYDCDLVFPTHDPIIMSVAQEVVKESYSRSGYPDRYKKDNILYVSSSQFGYAAAVDGIISRTKPASIFLLGTFEAESLILAETGNSIKAIQIAGTDSTIQLSFFIVACDYTLIGEELFAASGYLSGNKSILASVQAQDIMKIIIAVFILTAVIWASVEALSGNPLSYWWKL
ncbi:MAG TPA: hypothetical protein ENH23_05030 [candidate division Zixibacteria bacterium]|nr:hypothetical protein [candidate division Zixibacteria bacterium]